MLVGLVDDSEGTWSSADQTLGWSSSSVVDDFFILHKQQGFFMFLVSVEVEGISFYVTY